MTEAAGVGEPGEAERRDIETWRLTLPCTRAEAERLADDLPELALLDPPPVLMTSEPDPARPDRWQLDAYFEGRPSRILLRQVQALAPSSRRTLPRARPVPREDWVTLSQAGLAPLAVGRFRVRTPDHPKLPGCIDLVIPAGLAFGTGQHETTRGCLEILDAMKRGGRQFRHVLDLGTGTGLLAFAARRLWPAARVTASDIDPVSIAVVRENAALNGIRGVRLAVADGLDHRTLIAGAPYDLVVANILAGPLIEMAASIAMSLAPGGILMLAGLLDAQAAAVTRAYRSRGLRPVAQGSGEWPVLVMRRR